MQTATGLSSQHIRCPNCSKRLRAQGEYLAMLQLRQSGHEDQRLRSRARNTGYRPTGNSWKVATSRPQVVARLQPTYIIQLGILRLKCPRRIETSWRSRRPPSFTESTLLMPCQTMAPVQIQEIGPRAPTSRFTSTTRLRHRITPFQASALTRRVMRSLYRSRGTTAAMAARPAPRSSEGSIRTSPPRVRARPPPRLPSTTPTSSSRRPIQSMLGHRSAG